MGNSIEQRALRWALTGRVGASSRTLAAAMSGLENDASHPWDASDLLRCIWLLKEIPEWRATLGEMAKVSRYWAALVPHWNELESLMERGATERTYARMQAIFAPVEKEDHDRIRLGPGISVRVSR